MQKPLNNKSLHHKASRGLREWRLESFCGQGSTLLSFPTSRPPVELPLVLGLKYIWIDSLCILQENVADWKSELPRMDMIYRNAFVVFAAHGPELGSKRFQCSPIQISART